MKKNIDIIIIFIMLRKDYIKASNDNLSPSNCSISLKGLRTLASLMTFQESNDLSLIIKESNYKVIKIKLQK